MWERWGGREGGNWVVLQRGSDPTLPLAKAEVPNWCLQYGSMNIIHCTSLTENKSPSNHTLYDQLKYLIERDLFT